MRCELFKNSRQIIRSSQGVWEYSVGDLKSPAEWKNHSPEISLFTETVVSSLNLILKFNLRNTEIIGLLSFVVSAASF